MKNLMICSLLFFIGFTQQVHGLKYPIFQHKSFYLKNSILNHTCKAPPHKKTFLGAFYKTTEANEIEDDFLRSVAMGWKGAVECFLKTNILERGLHYESRALIVSIIYNPKFAKRFIDLGADLYITPGVGLMTKDFSGGRGGSSLHLAIAYDREQIVKMLLAKKVDVNRANGYFHNPLQSAVFYERFKMIGLLLKAGADPNKIIRGKSSFDIARTKKSPKYMKILTSHVKEKKRSKLF